MVCDRKTIAQCKSAIPETAKTPRFTLPWQRFFHFFFVCIKSIGGREGYMIAKWRYYSKMFLSSKHQQIQWDRLETWMPFSIHCGGTRKHISASLLQLSPRLHHCSQKREEICIYFFWCLIGSHFLPIFGTNHL